MAVLAPAAVALFGVLGAVITAPGFDVLLVNWSVVFHNLANALIVSAYSGFSGYILKNLLTDANQNFLGIPTNS